MRRGGGGDGADQGQLRRQLAGGGVGGAGATLSTLANYPKAKINKLISEALPLIGGARKCKQIWLAMRKADFRKEGLLNETNIKLIFET